MSGNQDDWRSQTVSPSRENPRPRVARYPSFAVFRLCGAVGFTSFGIVAFYAMRKALGLGPINYAHPSYSSDDWKVFSVAFLAAFGGMLTGVGTASNIEIRDDTKEQVISCMWHITANGALAYILTLGAEMSLVMGKEAAKAAVISYGPERAVLRLFLESLALGLVSGLLFAFGPRLRIPFALYGFVTVSLASGLAYLDNLAYDIHSWGVLGVGAFVMFATLILSPSMIARDREQRRLFLEGDAGEGLRTPRGRY